MKEEEVHDKRPRYNHTIAGVKCAEQQQATTDNLSPYCTSTIERSNDVEKSDLTRRNGYWSARQVYYYNTARHGNLPNQGKFDVFEANSAGNS